MKAPFDTARLDALMSGEGVDLVLATSRFNVRYLLGGHYFWIYEGSPAVGVTQWLPFVGYPTGRGDETFYVGHGVEEWQSENEPFVWMGNAQYRTWASGDAIELAVAEVHKLGLDNATIGIEPDFIPASAYRELRASLPQAHFVDGARLLERQRAVKSPWELEQMRIATELIVQAMTAVFVEAEPGETTGELTRRLAAHQAALGLRFDYCLATAGTSLLRAPGADRWDEGAIVSLDSGGDLHGYRGDVTRMAIRREPSNEEHAILEEILSVQDAAIAAARAGSDGQELVAAGRNALASCEHAASMFLDIHGLGLVTHEAPRLMPLGANTADHVDEQLEAGMVVSVETTFQRADLGFIKVEDTAAVTSSGGELWGSARDWTVVADGAR